MGDINTDGWTDTDYAAWYVGVFLVCGVNGRECSAALLRMLAWAPADCSDFDAWQHFDSMLTPKIQA